MSLDYEIIEFALAGAAGLLALIPTFLTYTAWKRTGSTRLLFAMLAFFSFTLRGILLGFAYQLSMPEIYHEVIEFGGDIVIITLFIIAFFSPNSLKIVHEEE